MHIGYGTLFFSSAVATHSPPSFYNAQKVCLSVIPLWRLLCCTAADPDRGVCLSSWVLCICAPALPLPPSTGSLREKVSCRVGRKLC